MPPASSPVLGPLLLRAAHAAAAPKAPFRMLFTNDTTNIASNANPYHGLG